MWILKEEERPTDEIQEQLGKEKKILMTVLPRKDFSQDSLDHWPVWNTRRNRCKLSKSNGFTYLSFTKCLYFYGSTKTKIATQISIINAK
ncbi:hypothetical protein NPIL_184081 [Nephila pilipes]|uniref:Uncharacterized protein n=1 Tax=Nephila pilipes TaxID=299642 RepID=A0A8X6PSV3_NEPPI|nr:hypothetical protein NPIL_184081 [Nephila pilipes]